MSIYAKIATLEEQGRRAALCTVVGTKGSTPRKRGAKMIVLENGTIIGTIGGGSLEKQVIQDALSIIHSQEAQLFNHALVHDHGMCCGGTVDIFIEPIVSKKRLYIFGAGHIGKALARFGHTLGFSLSLIDERPQMFDELEDLSVNKIVANHYDAFEQLVFDEETFVTVMTHDHAYDREIIAHCAKLPYSYLGMIGSERKVEIARKTFLAANTLSEAQMKHIDWPMGIKIDAQSPKEIAISILAKLINVRANPKI